MYSALDAVCIEGELRFGRGDNGGRGTQDW